MPQTIDTTPKGQIIGGIFTNRENADKAVKAFQKINVSFKDIQIVSILPNDEAKDHYTSLLVGRGFSETQALYYSKVIREGKMLVAVYEVTDPGPIIDVFDQCGAEYNPNGSRNLRHDVGGMTVGAVVGATAGGVAGAAMGGPVGAVAGAAAGGVVGGSSGAVAGKVVEHKK